jgi:hypothetical protein
MRWLFAAVFLCLEVASFIRIDSGSHSVSDTIRPFIIQSLLLGVIFLAVFSLIDRLRRARQFRFTDEQESDSLRAKE